MKLTCNREAGSPVGTFPSISLDYLGHPQKLSPHSLLSTPEQMQTDEMALGALFLPAPEDVLKLPYPAGEEGDVYRGRQM